MTINIHNILNIPNVLMGKWLKSRGWVVFYLEKRSRQCNDMCWLKLYEQE